MARGECQWGPELGREWVGSAFEMVRIFTTGLRRNSLLLSLPYTDSFQPVDSFVTKLHLGTPNFNHLYAIQNICQSLGYYEQDQGRINGCWKPWVGIEFAVIV